MKITAEIQNAIREGLHRATEDAEPHLTELYTNIIQNLRGVPRMQFADPDKPIQLGDFVRMFHKKKAEYLNGLMGNAAKDTADNELDDFLRFLIEQTGQFKKLNAERKELLSQADDKDREIRKYIENRWVEEAK